MGKSKVNYGDVIKIEMDDGTYCFGVQLNTIMVAYLDIKTNDVPDIETILKAPVLFKIWSSDAGFDSGKWSVIGHDKHKNREDIYDPVILYKQDIISKKLTLYDAQTGKEVPASQEECLGLEQAAVWHVNHVEDRLRDHYLGVPCKWGGPL